MNKYKEQALLEYNSAETAAHPGAVGGRPFWNLNSSQFMFAPSFQFPKIPGAHGYLFTAEDTNGKTHTFKADLPTASLAPIWGEIPAGIVRLNVESLDKSGNVKYLAGARTFFKSAPFPGRDELPPKARSYRECALAAFRFIYNEPMVQHWLIHGTPKPDYPHNVYPAKTIDSIIRAMVSYSKLDPENAENALNLARRAADYLLSISFDGDHPLAGLPPTYSFEGLIAEEVNKVAPAAQSCVGTTMMIYPVSAAIGYLTLAEATGDEKYFNAALKIAEYYKKTVLPCGSWYLLFDCESGKPLTNNVCVDFKFVNFFRTLYDKTNDAAWHELEIGCYKYITETCLKNYNWEGQFEDVAVSGNYQNLTHFTANNLIEYVSKNLSDNAEMTAEAVDLMRFVEDQFVVWGEHPKWNLNFDGEIRYSPAGLEQYYCYAPIDSSTATIMNGFINMYLLKNDRLYLEKAMALGDSITRAQDPTDGMVPTFWVGENYAYGRENFWINCQLYTATAMMHLAEVTEKEDIE
jgi:maltose/maltodextrin transport system substrate-binding protein